MFWFYLTIIFAITSGLALLGFTVRNAIVDQREDKKFIKTVEENARRNADRMIREGRRRLDD